MTERSPDSAARRADPIRVAAAVIEREGRYLLTLRPRGAHMSWFWEFPGGKLEPGERAPETLRRELVEEIGVVIDPGPLERRIRHDYPDRRVELLFHRARIVSGVPRPLEVAALGWFTPQEMLVLPLLEADRPLVEQLLRGRGGAR